MFAKFSAKLLQTSKGGRSVVFYGLLKKLNNIAVISNFLAFFLFLFEKFSLLDPDLQPCGFATSISPPLFFSF